MKAYPLFPTRNITELDGLWDFSLAIDTNPEDVSLSTPPTQKALVPGCFDTTPALYGKRGTAIYSRRVIVENSGRYRLNIGGLGLYGKVFWDGKEIDECKTPYSVYYIDIDATKGEHLLQILICNKLDRPDLVPLFTGVDDYYGFGGIYRSITLEELPTAPFIERVQVATEDLSGKLNLIFRINGNVQEASVALSIDSLPPTTHTLHIQDGKATLPLSVPGLTPWTQESPALHTLTATMGNDSVIERFGLRTIEVKGEEILLNGKRVYLRGFNRHESHPDLGPVLSPGLMLNDLQNLKELGSNYIRLVHYQQDPRFLDMCDELGFLCWEETIGFGIEGSRLSSEVGELTALALERMIRRNINNPSIIFWSFLNECRNNQPEAEPIYEKAVSTIRREDPTRLVSYCCWFNMLEPMRKMCDVMSFHMYPGWIGVEETDFSPASAHFEKAIREQVENCESSPNSKGKPIIFSETGTCALYGFHDRDLAPWSEEFQADYDEASVRALLKNKRITGFTIWQLYDTKSFTRGPYLRVKARGFNDAGVLDEYRRPKLSFDRLKPIITSIE